MEEWRPVVGYEGLYEVSSLGQIRGLKRGRILSQFPTDKGYLAARLTNVKGKTCRVHQLVAAAFLGPVPNGRVVDHIDANRGHNAATNLRYATYRENTLTGDSIPARNARKTQCLRGHAFTPENTGIRADGRRFCRPCKTH
jgi:hypothetical protein